MIEISNPYVSRELYRDWSFGDQTIHDGLDRFLKEGNINPDNHPRACDLCAGDGSWARMFVDRGWDSKNIVCIDQYKSPTPLVEGVTWRYWNLYSLGVSLYFKDDLPEEVLNYKNFFDIVALCQSSPSLAIGNKRMEMDICRFFAHPSGLMIGDSDLSETSAYCSIIKPAFLS